MSEILFPRLYAANMREIRRIVPHRVSLNLNMVPLSTATMEVDVDEDISVWSWVELFTPTESAGIFRVTEVQTEYGENPVKTVQLEHGICMLGDTVMHYGGEQSLSVTNALRNILQYANLNGSRWELGTVAATGNVVTDYNTLEDALSCVNGIMGQIPDYYLSFDQSDLPWKLNVVQRPTTATVDGRLSRNVISARITEDTTDLCTRVYAFRKNSQGDVDEWTVEDVDAVGVYGYIDAHYEVDDAMSTTQINKSITAYLNKHKAPHVSIEISGIDLAAVTGQTVDKFRIGERYRLDLPERQTSYSQNITAVSWPDVYDQPMVVSITLDTPNDKVTKMIHDNDKKKVTKKGKK